MCIIIYNELGKAYNQKYLETAYDNNPHGVGFMWVENGTLKTLRGLFTKKRFLKIAKDFDGVPHAIHLRWRTRGKISKDMCHPFRVSPKGAPKTMMMHNGTITAMRTNGKQSDTSLFAKMLKQQLKKASTDTLFTEKTLKNIEKSIDSWNKLLFMREDGSVSIVNPELWYLENGIMYSNEYSLKPGYRKEKQAKEAATSTIIYTNNKYKKDKARTPSAAPKARKPIDYVRLENGDQLRWFGTTAFRCHNSKWDKDPSMDRVADVTQPPTVGGETPGTIRKFGGKEFVRTDTGIWKLLKDSTDTVSELKPEKAKLVRVDSKKTQLLLPETAVVRRTRSANGDVTNTPIYPDVISRRNMLN